MVYHGIVLPHSGFTWRFFDETDYQLLKAMGLNAVCWEIWWAEDFEKEELQPGVYDETALSQLENQVALAKSFGFNVALSFHISFHLTGRNWVDVPRLGANYVNLNQMDNSGSFGRDRYVAFIKYMANRFKDCMIDPDGFPYHGGEDAATVNDETEKTFYDVTQPAYVQAIREVNDNMIILNALFQGVLNSSTGGRLETGQFLNSNFHIQNDSNIMYAINMHDGARYFADEDYNEIINNNGRWNGDLETLKKQLQPAVDFGKSHKVGTIEFGAMYPFSQPMEETRLAWLRANFEIFKNAGLSWFYHRYERPEDASLTGDGIYYPDGSINEIGLMINEFAPSIPKPTFAARTIGPFGVPASMIHQLWKLRQKYIRPEVHKKLHPLV